MPILVAVAIAFPSSTQAQLSEPCEIRCGLVLGSTAFVVGTSALVAWGRMTGGVSTSKEAAVAWGAGFAITLGGGVALGTEGVRQERAVYGAGLGAAVGAASGLIVSAVLQQAGRPRERRTHIVAATLVGAGIGALAGGIYGAISAEDGTSVTLPLLQLTWAH